MVKECFGPKTLCVIDRFHLVKEFNAQVDRIRLSVQRSARHERDSTQAKIRRLKEKTNFQSQEIQEEYRKLKAIHDEASDRYYLLSKFGSWMIFKHHNDNCFDENAEKKYNSHFQRYMNFAEIRRMLFELEPLLEQASQYQGLLTELYTYKSPEEGAEYFDSLTALLNESEADSIRHFKGTMKRWRTEILNSLLVVDRVYEVLKGGDVKIRDRRLHNGVIERKNKQIKILKNVANGYTNFARFRCRCLYVLRDRPEYLLDADYESKALRRKQKEDWEE